MRRVPMVSERNSTQMSCKIALIGLGRMGSGIAANIVKHGMELTVWNRTASKMAPLVAMGAKAAESAKQAAAAADIVVTSLMDDKSIIGTLNGEDGILAGLRPGSSHLCVTTISPDFADELTRIHSEHGSYYVSGPVVGRPSVDQLSAYLKHHWPAIREQLLSGTYEPEPVRRVEIPKPDVGVRKLGIGDDAPRVALDGSISMVGISAISAVMSWRMITPTA